jgi:succinoglycan biosynthesis transport protein ExoP
MENDEIDLSWIFHTLRRWWWMILGCTLLAGVSAYVATRLITPTYVARATLLIDPAKDTRSSDYTLLVAGERLALTYSQMVKGQPILQEVATRVGLDSYLGLADKIKAEPIPDTQLIRLTVTDASAEQAARLANTTAEVLIQYLQNLQTERYAKSLSSFQEQIDLLTTQVEEAQAKLDAAVDKKIKSDADLSRQQKLLDGYQREYNTLQQNYQDLQLASDQLKNSINIIEPAHIIETRNSPLFTASVTFLLPSEEMAQTYIQILTGRSLMQVVIDLLGLPESPELLATRVTAESIRNTQLLELTIKDSDSARAILIADGLATSFLNQVQQMVADPYINQLSIILDEMYTYTPKIEQAQQDIETLTTDSIQAATDQARLKEQIAEYSSDLRDIQQKDDDLRLTMAQAADAVVVTEAAQIPKNPTQNNLLYIGIATIVGLVIGTGAAFLLESLDDTIKTTEDVSKKLGLSTIGTIGVLTNGERGLVVDAKPRSPAAEAFRNLAANIRYASLDKPLKILLVTSPLPRDGKTLVASNLAAAIAQTEESVVVVDADLRLPRLHNLFGLAPEQGLTESILKNSVDGNLRTIHPDRLSVLTSGEVPPNPTEVIGSQRMHSILQLLMKKAKIVVIDCSPLLVAADAKTLATQVDGVLLVLRARETTTQAAREAVESLRQVNANIVGVVLNAEPRRKDSYYYHYHDRSDKHASKSWKKLRNIKIKIPQLLRPKRKTSLPLVDGGEEHIDQEPSSRLTQPSSLPLVDEDKEQTNLESSPQPKQNSLPLADEDKERTDQDPTSRRKRRPKPSLVDVGKEHTDQDPSLRPRGQTSLPPAEESKEDTDQNRSPRPKRRTSQSPVEEGQEHIDQKPTSNRKRRTKHPLVDEAQ